jgi:hypothetical protein
MRIPAISGSLRADSHSTSLLRTAAELTSLQLWDGLATVPPFNEDHEDAPAEAVHAMRAEAATADALLISTLCLPKTSSALVRQRRFLRLRRQRSLRQDDRSCCCDWFTSA